MAPRASMAGFPPTRSSAAAKRNWSSSPLAEIPVDGDRTGGADTRWRPQFRPALQCARRRPARPAVRPRYQPVLARACETSGLPDHGPKSLTGKLLVLLLTTARTLRASITTSYDGPSADHLRSVSRDPADSTPEVPHRPAAHPAPPRPVCLCPRRSSAPPARPPWNANSVRRGPCPRRGRGCRRRRRPRGDGRSPPRPPRPAVVSERSRSRPACGSPGSRARADDRACHDDRARFRVPRSCGPVSDRPSDRIRIPSSTVVPGSAGRARDARPAGFPARAQHRVGPAPARAVRGTSTGTLERVARLRVALDLEPTDARPVVRERIVPEWDDDRPGEGSRPAVRDRSRRRCDQARRRPRWRTGRCSRRRRFLRCSAAPWRT